MGCSQSNPDTQDEKNHENEKLQVTDRHRIEENSRELLRKDSDRSTTVCMYVLVNKWMNRWLDG